VAMTQSNCGYAFTKTCFGVEIEHRACQRCVGTSHSNIASLSFQMADVWGSPGYLSHHFEHFNLRTSTEVEHSTIGSFAVRMQQHLCEHLRVESVARTNSPDAGRKATRSRRRPSALASRKPKRGPALSNRTPLKVLQIQP